MVSYQSIVEHSIYALRWLRNNYWLFQLNKIKFERDKFYRACSTLYSTSTQTRTRNNHNKKNENKHKLSLLRLIDSNSFCSRNIIDHRANQELSKQSQLPCGKNNSVLIKKLMIPMLIDNDFIIFPLNLDNILIDIIKDLIEDKNEENEQIYMANLKSKYSRNINNGNGMGNKNEKNTAFKRIDSKILESTKDISQLLIYYSECTNGTSIGNGLISIDDTSIIKKLFEIVYLKWNQVVNQIWNFQSMNRNIKMKDMIETDTQLFTQTMNKITILGYFVVYCITVKNKNKNMNESKSQSKDQKCLIRNAMLCCWISTMLNELEQVYSDYCKTKKTKTRKNKNKNKNNDCENINVLRAMIINIFSHLMIKLFEKNEYFTQNIWNDKLLQNIIELSKGKELNIFHELNLSGINRICTSFNTPSVRNIVSNSNVNQFAKERIQYQKKLVQLQQVVQRNTKIEKDKNVTDTKVACKWSVTDKCKFEPIGVVFNARNNSQINVKINKFELN